MILLSAGHYPRKPGICFPGFNEHSEALLYCTAIRRELGTLGVKAHLINPGRLLSKVEQIEKRSSLLAVEIHFNNISIANKIRQHEGSQVLYRPGSHKGMAAADIVQSLLWPVFGYSAGIAPGWHGGNPANGIDHFLTAKGTTCLIVVPEFAANTQRINEYRAPACRMIAEGIAVALGSIPG